MILIEEIDTFTADVENRIYEPLLMFGEEKEFLPANVVTENKEYYVTKLVSVLNDIHLVIKNLNVLLKALTSQLHNLYWKGLKEYGNVFKKVLLLDAFENIGIIMVLSNNP